VQLEQVGWNERVQALFGTYAPEGAVPARVSAVFRSSCRVVTAAGEIDAVARPLPAVGDWVVLRSAREPVVDLVLPAWSALTRTDPGTGSPQVLAANVDVVVVVAPGDRLRLSRVERELVAAWDSGAQPIVVVTKNDLLEDRDATLDTVRARAIGVEVIGTSTETGDGVDAVAALLRPDRTAVLLGPSGAGKSSLANALLGATIMAIGDVREEDHRGRHTTTSRNLFALPGGGVLIDTPGLRSLGITDGGGISSTFSDIEELASLCRFSDCMHEGEPGCAVAAAVLAGDLDQARLQNYRKLEREAAYAARRDDRIAAAAEAERWKAITKANRSRPPKQINR
jgi:ribosome small subunit-dependent GTPase A